MFKSYKKLLLGIWAVSFLVLVTSCDNNPSGSNDPDPVTRTSSASQSDVVTFSGSQSSSTGAVYEILPGPAAMMPAMNPTPFSNNVIATTGAYSFKIQDLGILPNDVHVINKFSKDWAN